MEGFSAAIEPEGNVIAVNLRGELDAFTAPRVREALGSSCAGGMVVIDLSAVTFIDSAGLGVLIGGIRRIREAGGDVMVCCASGVIRRVLHTVGLERIVRVVEARAQAATLHARDDAPDAERR